MDFIRKWITQAQAHLSGLSLSTKMLMGMCVVFLIATLGVVALYAGRAELAPLIDQPIAATERATITSYLDMRDIKYELRGDRVWVPVERRIDVLAALQTNQMLPEDTSHGFAKLLEGQSIWQSTEQGRMNFDIALQNELSRIVSRMRGVDSASVIISRPQKTGFGASNKHPSASVNVEPTGGSLNRKTAEAIAGLVAGAVAEMQPPDVTVIDSHAGRQFRTQDDSAYGGTELIEMVQGQERLYREKIADVLGYIPKVIVAVSVEVEPTRKHTDSVAYDRAKSVEPMISSEDSETSSSSPIAGGEPGARSNTGADIEGGGAVTQTSNTTTAKKEFAPKTGYEHTTAYNPAGVPTRISATVNVPRSYFVALYNQANPPAEGEEAKEPTDTELQPLVDDHLKRIKDQVMNLVSWQNDGRVVVDVYPDQSLAVALAGMGVRGGGGVGGLLGNGMIKTGGLGALALVAVFVVFMMARKPMKEQEVPSAVELAGLPPDLTAEDDVAGEAGEVETALTGIELDDDQLASRKVSEQVTAMIKNDPIEAAQLLKRWVRQED